MDETENELKEINAGIPVVKQIPNQLIVAGDAFDLDLRSFIVEPESKDVTYTLEDFPEGFRVDDEGQLLGTAPKAELNEIYEVKVKFTDNTNQKSAMVFFRLEVVGTLLIGTPEARAYFAGEKPERFWTYTEQYEVQQFIQQLLNEHFLWLYFHDGKNPPSESGKFLKLHQAKTGWNIYEFEHVVMINAGDKTYAQYGNRRRFLDTVKEVYKKYIPQRNWASIGIEGSDSENIGKAWVVGKQLAMPLAQAPTQIAELNLYNIKQIAEKFPPKLTPKP